MKETLCQCQTTHAADGQTTPVTLEIPVALLGQLQEAAALAGTDHHTLLICYARQGLVNSEAQLKRERFFEHAKEVLENHGIQKTAIEAIFNKFLY